MTLELNKIERFSLIQRTSDISNFTQL